MLLKGTYKMECSFALNLHLQPSLEPEEEERNLTARQLQVGVLPF